MVVSRREGTNIFYTVANPKIFKAMDTMKELLLERLQEEQAFVADAAPASKDQEIKSRDGRIMSEPITIYTSPG